MKKIKRLLKRIAQVWRMIRHRPTLSDIYKIEDDE